jgi:hypothetical protein
LNKWKNFWLEIREILKEKNIYLKGIIAIREKVPVSQAKSLGTFYKMCNKTSVQCEKAKKN